MSVLSNIIKIAKPVAKIIKNHRRAIATVSSIAGAGATAYFTYKATCKAKDAIEEEIERRAVHNENIEEAAIDTGEKKVSLTLTPKEKFKLTYKFYITPAIFLALTTATIISNAVYDKIEFDKTVSLLALGDVAYQEHRDKIKEKLGADVLEEIDKDVAHDHAKKALSDDKDHNKRRSGSTKIDSIKYTPNGGDYFIDSWSQQKFTCSLEYIRKVVNDINSRCLNHVSDATLNDYYYELNLDPVDEGDLRGWDYGHLMDIDTSESEIKDGRAYIIVRFRNRPHYL